LQYMYIKSKKKKKKYVEDNIAAKHTSRKPFQISKNYVHFR
jgi:hypothetical protein